MPLETVSLSKMSSLLLEGVQHNGTTVGNSPTVFLSNIMTQLKPEETNTTYFTVVLGCRPNK
uniref:Uncharacterized protein n=1 Tax=Arundo donax TaxID=35708 RepID=A0A0A9F6H2_ARUDO